MRRVFVQMDNDGPLVEIHKIVAKRRDDGGLVAKLFNEEEILPHAILPVEYVENNEGFEVIVNGMVMTLKEIVET